ncbi:MAG: hypothetical protein ABI821_16965 [Pseudomonadota bacterium]
MNASNLVIGRAYYRLMFANLELTIPGVEPLIFLGQVTEESGTNGFVFQDTASYIQHGSGLEGDEQHEDIVLYFMPDSEVGTMYDIEELALELAQAARRAIAANHPALRVLRREPKIGS